MSIFKKYYKIVRNIQIDDMVIKHSCYIPIIHYKSISYKVGKWVDGEDMFVYDDTNFGRLGFLVEAIAASLAVVDPDDYDNDDLDCIRIELWECSVGKCKPINIAFMKPVHIFLKVPETGRRYIQIAKDQYTSDTVLEDIVTDRVKLTKLVFAHEEKKIMFNERIINHETK